MAIKSIVSSYIIVFLLQVKISAFPPSIEHLSLKGCEIVNPPTDSSYFNSIISHLPHLKACFYFILTVFLSLSTVFK